MRTEERVVLINKAREYFTNRLKACTEFDHDVENVVIADEEVIIDGERFDYIIDTSWGHFQKPPIHVIFQPTILLYYEGPASHPALTMVDGPLCSVYPTEDEGLFTLSSVPFSPLGDYASSLEAKARLSQISKVEIIKKVNQMEDQISHYLPWFKDTFRFVGPQLSIKTKVVGSSDDRSCSVYQNGRCFSVMSGKIDTIFFAFERILSSLEIDTDSDIFSDRLTAEARLEWMSL